MPTFKELSNWRSQKKRVTLANLASGNYIPSEAAHISHDIWPNAITKKVVEQKVEEVYSASKTLTNKVIDFAPGANSIMHGEMLWPVIVNFDDGPTVEVMTAQYMIFSYVYCEIIEAFNGNQDNNVLKVGDEDNLEGFILNLGGTGKNTLSQTGVKSEEPCSRSGLFLYPASCGGPKYKHYNSNSKKIIITVEKDDSCTQGRALILFKYCPYSGIPVVQAGAFSDDFSDDFDT